MYYSDHMERRLRTLAISTVIDSILFTFFLILAVWDLWHGKYISACLSAFFAIVDFYFITLDYRMMKRLFKDALYPWRNDCRCDGYY